MRERFREYLISKRYAATTVNSYLSGLNHLSIDYGSEILDVTDFETVSNIRRKYNIGGESRNIGDYGKGCARNAIIQYTNFIECNGELDSVAVSSEEVVEQEPVSASSRFSYERDLHNTLEAQTEDLFPGYELVASEYSIGNVRLDLLLKKDNELLVVELKAGLASYEVFGQISMYMGIIKEKFPDRDVKGVIIASDIHSGLISACSTNRLISCKKYSMKISLEDVNVF